MAGNPRLLIGAYIIDAADSGNTSTTVGVKLRTLDGPGCSWTEDREGAEIRVLVSIAAATADALKTAMDALTAAVVLPLHADLTLQHTSGSAIKTWAVSTGEWSRIRGSIETEAQELTAICLLVFRAERIGGSTTGAGDPGNSLDGIQWDMGLDSAGLATLAATATFKTRTLAITWDALMRASANWPSWMDASRWRYASRRFPFEQQAGQASPVPASGYTPCVIQILFNQLPLQFDGDSAFDDVIDVHYDSTASQRDPLNVRSGATPGYDLLISGTLQFKIHADPSWDSADTTYVGAAALDAKIRACLASIETDVKNRHGIQTYQRLRDPLIVPGGKSGIVAFQISALAGGGGVLNWRETIILERRSRNPILDGVNGARLFKHRAGPRLTVRHTLSAQALNVLSYAPPNGIGGDEWEEQMFAVTDFSVEDGEGDAVAIYSMGWSGEWEYLGSSAPEGAYEYGSALPDSGAGALGAELVIGSDS